MVKDCLNVAACRRSDPEGRRPLAEPSGGVEGGRVCRRPGGLVITELCEPGRYPGPGRCVCAHVFELDKSVLAADPADPADHAEKELLETVRRIIVKCQEVRF